MTFSSANRPHTSLLNPTLLIVGLGNFIDSFDLFLFTALRSSSLHDLGFDGEALTKAGIQILNCQVVGIFIGGFLWGVLGDKIGRKKALIGSILLYSFGSLACAFVHSLSAYSLMRFITGIGIAGELGLGATLVTETVPDDKRSWALGIFACFGAVAVFASNALPEFLSWRGCYAAGGIAGLVLLLLRLAMAESGLFTALLRTKVHRESVLSLLHRPAFLKRWFFCVSLFMPQVFVTGFLMTFAPEIGKALDATAPIKANVAFMAYFIGQFVADLAGVIISNIFRRRVRVAFFYLIAASAMVMRYLTLDHPSEGAFYLCCGIMGLCSFFIMSSFMMIEQFGTNIRATACTSAMSTGRTTLVLTNLLFLALHGGVGLGIIAAVACVSAFVFAMGFLGLSGLKETYDQSLDFIEAK